MPVEAVLGRNRAGFQIFVIAICHAANTRHPYPVIYDAVRCHGLLSVHLAKPSFGRRRAPGHAECAYSQHVLHEEHWRESLTSLWV